MSPLVHRLQEFLRFYLAADTKYRIHSPHVFEMVESVLADERYFYAFEDIERVREKMAMDYSVVEITDYGSGPGGADSEGLGIRVQKRFAQLRQIVRMAGSPRTQCQRLYRIVEYFKPKTMLELGTSVGVSTMYLASAAPDAKIISLEGCPNCAEIARINLDILKLNHAEVVTGVFEISLKPALKKLGQVDMVFFDGNHRREPTVRYFETCLEHANENAVFIFDDIYWSPGMTKAWEEIKQHPRVTATVDFFDISLAFFSADFREKQHFRVVPKNWKFWQVLF